MLTTAINTHPTREVASRLHGFQVEAIEEQHELRTIDLERAALDALGMQPGSVAVPLRDLHPVTTMVEEHEECSPERILLEAEASQIAEAIEGLAQIRGIARDVDRCAGRNRDHPWGSASIKASVIRDAVSPSTAVSSSSSFDRPRAVEQGNDVWSECRFAQITVRVDARDVSVTHALLEGWPTDSRYSTRAYGRFGACARLRLEPGRETVLRTRLVVARGSVDPRALVAATGRDRSVLSARLTVAR